MPLAAWLSDATRDARHGLRSLRHRPGFALAAILPLALGLGAATAMYSVVDGVMLRPLPFPEPERIVSIWSTEDQWKGNTAVALKWDRIVIGKDDYQGLSEGKSFAKVAAWTPDRAMMGDASGGFAQTYGIRVTATIFDVLGVRPLLGRLIAPGEDAVGGGAVALLSYEAWQLRFGGDSSVVGRSIIFNENPVTIIGVMPAGVRLDRSSPVPGYWIPAFQSPYDDPSHHNRSYRGLARLKPGVTVAQASEEAGRIIREVKIAWNGDAKGTGGLATSYQEDQTASIRPSLIILGGATALLLLIACVNLAILMLGESSRRQPEMAARTALGAGPARLIRQLFAESMVISTSAAALGLALGWALTRVLVSLAPANIPGLSDVHFDLRVFLFAVACAIVAGLVSGVLPAFALLRWGRHQVVGSATGLTARGELLVQRVLVGVEVALSIVMLVGCSLLGRSLVRLSNVDPGFGVSGLMYVSVDAPSKVWADSITAVNFVRSAVRELEGISGVVAVSGANAGLFNGSGSSSPIKRVGKPEPEVRRDVQQRVVLPNYFRTMQLPLISGRDFTEQDNASSEAVAIISQAEVERDFPGESPLGQRVVWQGQQWTVIGVAADAHYKKLDSDYQPTIYIPSRQWDGNWMNYIVRTAPGIDGTLLAGAIKERLLALNAAITVKEVNPVPTMMQSSYAEERYRTMLGSLFGIIGTVLAAFGMFGVVARTVARRMREAGIRSALGASAKSLTRLMLRETVIGALFGIGLGIPAAAWLARSLTPYLFGVTSADPMAYLLALGLFTLAGAVATIPSARRAAEVDPAIVMRSE
jgi:putative ABC transport system permease protein